MTIKTIIHSSMAVLIFLFCINTSIVQSRVLQMGVENIEYYPIYANRDGKYTGYARELFDAFAEKYGHTILYKPLPVKRLFKEFLNGQLDLKFPDNIHWASEQKTGKNIIYSHEVLEYIDGVMVLPENLRKGKEELIKLGTVRGFTPWDYMSEIKSGAVRITENTSLDGLIKMVKAEKINGVYSNIVVARYFLKHTLLQKNALMFDKSLPHSKDSYLVSTINNPDVIKQINTFLKDEAEFVTKLKIKYEVDL